MLGGGVGRRAVAGGFRHHAASRQAPLCAGFGGLSLTLALLSELLLGVRWGAALPHAPGGSLLGSQPHVCPGRGLAAAPTQPRESCRGSPCTRVRGFRVSLLPRPGGLRPGARPSAGTPAPPRSCAWAGGRGCRSLPACRSRFLRGGCDLAGMRGWRGSTLQARFAVLFIAPWARPARARLCSVHACERTRVPSPGCAQHAHPACCFPLLLSDPAPPARPGRRPQACGWDRVGGCPGREGSLVARASCRRALCLQGDACSRGSRGRGLGLCQRVARVLQAGAGPAVVPGRLQGLGQLSFRLRWEAALGGEQQASGAGLPVAPAAMGQLPRGGALV